MNNGRNVNMTNVHGMNRQQQRPNPNQQHFNQQQTNSHHRVPGAHPQRPGGNNPQQQRNPQNVIIL